jgi:hypothetical protein
MRKLIREVEGSISAGRNDAALIPWMPRLSLFGVEEHDPAFAILTAISAFTAHGWELDRKENVIRKDGWYAFFRSQGQLAPPIAQWQRERAA